MLQKFIAFWLGLAFIIYAVFFLWTDVRLPLLWFFGGSALVGLINFLISTSIHKKYFDGLLDKIQDKTPSLPRSEAEDIYRHFEETIINLLHHDQQSSNQLQESAVKLKELDEELQTDKIDLEEQLKAISELYEEIVSLYEIGRTLGSIIDLPQLLKTILEMSSDTIGARTGVLMLLNEAEDVLEIHDQIGYPANSLPRHIPSSLGLAAQVIERKASIIISDLDNNPAFKDLPRYGFETNSCLLTPLLLQDKAIGIICLGDRLTGEIFTAGNEKLLSTLSNQAAIFIENIRLFEKSLAQQRMQEQLKIAHEIQLSLLPSASPELAGYDIYGSSIPAVEVGGDYFDYLKLNDDNSLGLIIGDVSGKGVPAALLMTMTRSLLRSQASRLTSPSQLLTTVNNQLVRENIPDRFVTMIYAQLNAKTQELNFCSAGHDALIVYHASMDKFSSYHPAGMVLGILPDQKLEEMKLHLKKDDIALMYTDGVTEAMNIDRQQFGVENFESVVRENRHLGARELTEKIIEQVRVFSRDCPQHDDITLLVVKGV